MIISSRTRNIVSSRTSFRKLLKYTQKRHKNNECEEKDCCGRPIYKPDPTNYIIEKSCTKCNYFEEWKPKVPRLDNCISAKLQKLDKCEPKKCTADLNNTNKRKTRCEIQQEAGVRFKQNDPKSVATYKPPPPPKCKAPNMNCVGGPKGDKKKKCIKPIPIPDWDPNGILE